MNLNIRPVKDWFGFTRRERRSTFVLLIIVVIIIGFRYTIPDRKIIIEVVPDSLLFEESRAVVNSVRNYETKSSLSDPDRNKFRTSYVTKPKSIHPVIQKEAKYSYRKQHVVELNGSDSLTLVGLPGIGPVLSARIIKYRNLLGGYATIGQLQEVYGLSPETFELIKNCVSADSSFIKRINLNTADYKGLSHIRYLEKYEISAILKYRQLKGIIGGMNELIENKIITKEKARKIGPYLKFGE
jgi:competence protein ComEA